MGLELVSLGVGTLDELNEAFERAARERVDALLPMEHDFLAVNRARVVELALGHRLPGMYFNRDFAHLGGLMAYSSNTLERYRRAAVFVDRILKGASPADLPVEQPMVFDLIINLKTAQALGLTIPPHVLLQATEVIQ
jgi:putative ABC transport system substrate-binding protein